ncbi:hypothetical protein KU309_23615 [Salmonella enterica subsp. enterica serovar Mbandaka]|nr:hypothetical protein [Salmonella enterica subsp. enterica serovar Mbandaka]MCO9568432.1 hypothetical protein [Salmonella enterica subsp. enterica serovar Mbandaka]MCO9779854.1 hypothetical protein [Salmonella enterica subsp. enterica serovar Mbandaka]MCO9808999.1 hypothetical protein [Salmonella enterica subsp. enterica serovar Mbandaka]MCP0581391.1 hypothetical protein [Salmonella enterica subsp. enterica serovar Mbandaka]
MADEDVGISAAKVVGEALQWDGKKPRLTYLSRCVGEALAISELNIEAAKNFGEVLQWDGKLPSIFRAAKVVGEVLAVEKPEIRASTLICEALTKEPFFMAAEMICEAIGQAATERPPLYADAVYQYVTQHDVVPPLSDVISTERLYSLWNYAIVQQPIDDPISYNIVKQAVTLSVLASPIVAMSYDMVKFAWSFAVAAATLGDFPLPDEMWSKTRTKQVWNLVLQSIDIPYVPTSGVFAIQNTTLVVQAHPLPMYTTPASVKSNVVLAAQKRPVERLPRSLTRVAQELSQAVSALPIPMPRSNVFAAQALSQAVIPADFVDPTVGVEHAAAVTSYAVCEYQVSLPISYTRAKTLTPLVLQFSDSQRTIPQSTTRTKHVSTQFVVKSDLFPVLSFSRVKQVRSYAVQETAYTPPINLLVWSRADAVRTSVVQQATDYPDPGIPTTSAIVGAATAYHVMKALDYEDPNDMWEASKVQMVPQFVEKVLKAQPLRLPISYAPLAQYVELVTQYHYMPPPGEVAESGIHVRQVMQPVAFRATYPDPTVPVSFLTVNQVLEHIAIPADYPDVHLPTSDAIVNQVLEHVAQIDDFPDPGTMFRPLIVSQIIQQAAQDASYPDWSTLHKPIAVQQVIQHVSMTAEYPDKDIPQSFAKVSQVLQHYADIANYPDKDAPQSTLRVRQVLEQVMMRDKSMYEMPQPPRKHRVQITCRFVY